jgi:hypothetical protein
MNKGRYRRQAYDRKQFIAFVLDALRAKPCGDCGKRYPPICMDFDHVRGKNRAIHDLVKNSCGINKVIDEVNKCGLCYMPQEKDSKTW